MRIPANGLNLNYELTGKAGAPVVMLSHSLGASLAMWEPQRAVLEPYFQVLAYDMRGHGASDAPGVAYTLEQLAQDAVGLMDVLNISRVHFVGLSIGGMIAQALALNHADRLLSLALCSTSAFLPPPARPIVQERIILARGQGLGALVDSTMERWFTPPYSQENPEKIALVRRQFLATPVDGYIGCSEAISQLNFIEQLPNITLPTLILVGAEDIGTPVAASEAIQEKISGAKLFILPSASHLANIEQAELFNKYLLEFLNSSHPEKAFSG
ncbi:MAG TPA: 3-oxoadipate enol-lactonase [Thermodesulfobacteriota bacterium]|nr:3-oxoadipate enol-lactonase [Thermodesulfobacteriota bacterium]